MESVSHEIHIISNCACLIILRLVLNLCVHVCALVCVIVALKGAHTSIHSLKDDDNNPPHLHTAGSTYSKVHKLSLLQNWAKQTLKTVLYLCLHFFYT